MLKSGWNTLYVDHGTYWSAPVILNQDILNLSIQNPGQMPLHVRREVTREDETNHKTYDIHMNVCDNPENVIKPISFRLFDRQRNSGTYNGHCHHSSRSS
jgi:hypothetical protein